MFSKICINVTFYRINEFRKKIVKKREFSDMIQRHD